MIFIVSDLHLGKSPDTDTESLQELNACIEASGASKVVFLGDVFDAFIESRHRPPFIVQKWGELAAALRDSGIDITYVMGNHDRWHRRFVSDVIGVAPIRGAACIKLGTEAIHLEHGDDGQPHQPATNVARWLSDQPLIYHTYTTLLPFGGAQRLAAAVSRRFASFEPDPSTVQALQHHALRTLESSDAAGVVMGHCHQPGLFDLSEKLGRPAWYANSGDWYERRSFVLLPDDPRAVQLGTWRSDGIQIEAALSNNQIA